MLFFLRKLFVLIMKANLENLFILKLVSWMCNMKDLCERYDDTSLNFPFSSSLLNGCFFSFCFFFVFCLFVLPLILQSNLLVSVPCKLAVAFS